MKREKIAPSDSAGIIPLALTKEGWQVFLVQYREYEQYWGCPKGHIESDETPEQAARRELTEETGLEVVTLLQKEPILEEFYWLKNEARLLKRIYFFVAQVSGTVRLQKDELNSGGWFFLPQAIEQVIHPEGKATLRKVEQIITEVQSSKETRYG